MIRIFFLSQSSPILELFPFDKITLKSYICTVVTVMAKQCWSRTVLESGSWGHSVLQTPALVYLSCSVEYFLFPVFLCSFVIPFTDNICSFHFSFFDLVILLLSSLMSCIFATVNADHYSIVWSSLFVMGKPYYLYPRLCGRVI